MLVSCLAYFSTLKMKTTHSSKKSVDFQRTARVYMPSKASNICTEPYIVPQGLVAGLWWKAGAESAIWNCYRRRFHPYLQQFLQVARVKIFCLWTSLLSLLIKRAILSVSTLTLANTILIILTKSVFIF
jgi:hypothetical protein